MQIQDILTGFSAKITPANGLALVKIYWDGERVGPDYYGDMETAQDWAWELIGKHAMEAAK